MSCGPYEHQQRAYARAQERVQRETERADRRAEGQRARKESQRQMWSAAVTGAVNGAMNGARGAAPPQPQLRIGDQERESAISALSDHYVAGRLSKEEFDERAGSAYAARTSADLAALFGDLPRLTPPPPQKSDNQREHRYRGFRLSWVFVLMLGLAVLGVIPWFAVAIFAGLWWTGMFSGFHGHRRH